MNMNVPALDNVLRALSAAHNLVAFEDRNVSHHEACDVWRAIIARGGAL